MKLPRTLCWLTLPLFFVLSHCHKDEINKQGQISIQFDHLINGEPVVYNSLQYLNAAGNHYEVKEVQWFISDISLILENGNEVPIGADRIARYVDTNIPSTLTHILPEKVPSSKYNAIKFTFGLKGGKNIPGQFSDLPESNMIWPYALGGDYGGYHYIKLNGFWMNLQDQRTPFNFHIGVGQIYNDKNEVSEFVQNWFEVSIPLQFSVSSGEIQSIKINMDIANWFDTPHVYDHNTYGGMIMKNQEAMGLIKANGVNVFSAERVTPN